METRERICTLCLQIYDNFEPIEGYTKDAINVLLPKLDLPAILKSVVCINCKEMLVTCSDFKAMCFNTLDYIVPYINKDNVKLDLKTVFLNKSENCFLEYQDICGFCMSPVEDCSAVFLDVEQGDVKLKIMIEQCLPELDLSIIERPVICVSCHGSLEKCFHFITNCLIAEEKIKKYWDTLDINGEGQIELSKLLEVTVRDVTTIEKRENANERHVDNESNIFKFEQMSGDGSETVNTVKEEDDLKFDNQEKFTSKYKLKCENVIEIEEKFYGKNELKEESVEMEDQKFLVNEDTKIKPEESDFNRFEEGIILQQSETKLYRNRTSLMLDHGGDLETATNKNVLTLKTGQSKSSLSQTKYRHHLKTHKERKNPTEVTMHKCDSCSFQSKHKFSLKRHHLKHKDPLDVKMYKCDSCLYQTTSKGSLKKHLLRHKNPSEITTYKCDSCSFQTIHTGAFKAHLQKHRNPSEIKMYKCESCSYQTKYKKCLMIHLLKHKDLSEVTTYKCDSCSFQTKLKSSLRKHVLGHKDPSEVTMYKCDFCTFQTRNSYYIKVHLLGHKNPAEVLMYKCASCSYQTRYKNCHKLHSLKHKKLSEVATYKCDSCSYETKHKRCLKIHELTHKDPSEVTMYKCDSCEYQTKHKNGLKIHLLKHKVL